MKKLTILIALISWFAVSYTFAQRGARPQAQPQTASAVIVEENGIPFIRFPQQNDEAGITARNVLEAAQRIISPQAIASPPDAEFSFMQATEDDRKALFQQAIDTLQTLLVFINPPKEEEVQVALAYDQLDAQVAFVPNAFVNAHYLLGMAWTYLTMAGVFDLFSMEETADFTKKAIEYFEAFIQNGVAGNAPFVYAILGNAYFQQDDPRRALISIDRAIALEPREPFHQITRARILQGQGYLEQACASLQRARDLGEREASVNMMQEFGC